LICHGLSVSAKRNMGQKDHHIKMRLDTLRILGLIICTKQSENLILLSHGPNNELVEQIQASYLNLAVVFQSIPLYDMHRNTYLNHLEYEILHASPTLEQFGLIALAKNVHEFMRSTLYSGGLFPTQDIKSELLPKISDAIKEKLHYLEIRDDLCYQWTPLDETCLPNRLEKLKSVFSTNAGHWISWHIKIMKTE